MKTYVTIYEMLWFLYILYLEWFIPSSEGITMSSPNNTWDEGLQEEWVSRAIKDIAFFLRSHKFNEFDRRYRTEKNPLYNYWTKFPEPPLRTLHWKVHESCSKGFIHCIEYLVSVVEKTNLRRVLDTSNLAYENSWDMTKDKDKISNADKNCRILLKMDENDDLFEGPVSKFRWRTTASYYMCWFTMQEKPELKMFGEPCDSFGSCSWNNYQVRNNDPRADDKKPFFCAMYSFCPDVCCPLKYVKDTLECFKWSGNPCNELDDKSCSFERTKNSDFQSIIKNRWNATCICDKGFTWDSRFGMCVDIDECYLNADKCDHRAETCLNTKGGYTCSCAWGFKYKNKKCTSLINGNVNLTGERKVEKKKNIREEFKDFLHLKNNANVLFKVLNIYGFLIFLNFL